MTTRVQLFFVTVLVLVGAGSYARLTHPPAAPLIASAPVTHGDIVVVSKATGALQASRTVEVGTQVSGTVERLLVDGDDIVHKGQVLARLDPSAAQTDLESARAALGASQAMLDEDEAIAENDRANLQRAEQLLNHDLLSEQDYDTTQSQAEADESKVQQDRQVITVQQKGVEQAELNLEHCTITAPADGVIISREVDEGQVVVARVDAPGLFIMAADLTRLTLMAQVDEADVGRIHEGQTVAVSVPSYPTSTFTGTIATIRLTSTTVNNVVTFDTVVSVANADLRLRPGMTATLRVETGRAMNVLRLPSIALSLTPTEEAIAATREVERAPQREPPGARHVWVARGQQLERLAIQTGVTDGVWTEIRSDNLHDGDAVVTSIVLPRTRQP